MQKRCNSSALAMELCLFLIKPSIYVKYGFLPLLKFTAVKHFSDLLLWSTQIHF